MWPPPPAPCMGGLPRAGCHMRCCLHCATIGKRPAIGTHREAPMAELAGRLDGLGTVQLGRQAGAAHPSSCAAGERSSLVGRRRGREGVAEHRERGGAAMQCAANLPAAATCKFSSSTCPSAQRHTHACGMLLRGAEGAGVCLAEQAVLAGLVFFCLLPAQERLNWRTHPGLLFNTATITRPSSTSQHAPPPPPASACTHANNTQLSRAHTHSRPPPLKSPRTAAATTSSSCHTACTALFNAGSGL